MFEWLLRRHSSTATCHGDRGSGCSRPGRQCVSPNIESPSRQPTNWRTIIPKKFLHCCKSSRAHNRFPNLGIWQRYWEPPGNLTLKASGIWLQNFHRTGETDSWRTQTKSCAHQDPGESSSDPTRDWARPAYECPGVSSWGEDQHWPAVGLEALNTTVPARVLLKEIHYPLTYTSRENWIKYLLSVAPPIRTRPRPPPQPVPPIRKLPQASYPYPSEGRENGNHNYREQNG